MSARSLAIAGRQIGDGNPPYIIAELSANHNGDIDRAFAIMGAAKAAGADAIKLQTYNADSLTIDHDGPGFRLEGGLWGGRTLHDLYLEAAMPWEWHEPLFARAHALGITVFSSPFDNAAVDLLEGLEAPAYKIASFEATDLPLIERVAATGKPVIISTGMSDHHEIEAAVAAARRAGCAQLVLLHCVSAYPAPPEESNLLTIPDMAARFDAVIGLSDHTLGGAVAVAAVSLGAAVIEKHFTVSRADGGPDSEFSLEPAELETLVRDARIAHAALGQVHYKAAPSAEANLVLRRSLYVVEDIAAGVPFSERNVRSIRPGYGLAPQHLAAVLGRRAGLDVARGTPMSWDLIADEK
jgi:N-acetylneuraminate synthase